jgi:hypothetical protein
MLKRKLGKPVILYKKNWSCSPFTGFSISSDMTTEIAKNNA